MNIQKNWLLKSCENNSIDWDDDYSLPFSQEEINKIVEKILHPLNSMTKVKARRFVNQLLGNYSKGLFSDDYWTPIHKMFDVMSQSGIDVTLIDTKYFHDENGNPNAKEWKFEVEFKNEKGNDSKLYGIIRASGAGTVKDPLSSYDVVAYVT